MYPGCLADVVSGMCYGIVANGRQYIMHMYTSYIGGNPPPGGEKIVSKIEAKNYKLKRRGANHGPGLSESGGKEKMERTRDLNPIVEPPASSALPLT